MDVKDSSLVFIHETEDEILLGTKEGKLKVVKKYITPQPASSAELTIKISVPREENDEDGGYTCPDTEVVALQKIKAHNGDILHIGFSALTGKWYLAERKPTKIVSYHDFISDAIIFKFYDDNGILTHVRKAPIMKLADGSGFCPACLMHRQEIQITKRIGGTSTQGCPVCQGVVTSANVLCSCGKIPHDKSCQMYPILGIV